ncbi:unnamed protein product [Caenorhabditis angaria]|uniref:Uncharacterized protein n=1 Tax=Caenorhabditis angaria TaxID=860376 RepID=A0A9P1MYW3_9PELO|nr:unnamed protein product [Caenorhabditis angaria]
MRLLIVFAIIIQLSLSTNFIIHNNFACPGRRFAVRFYIYEFDLTSNANMIGNSGSHFDNNGEIVVNGTTENNDLSDDKEYFLYSWLYHNCTTTGREKCLVNFLSRTNPNVREVTINYLVNLADNKYYGCSWYRDVIVNGNYRLF